MKKQFYSNCCAVALYLLVGGVAQEGLAQRALAFSQQTNKTEQPGHAGQKRISLKEAFTALKGHYKVDIVFKDRAVENFSVATKDVDFRLGLEENLAIILRSTSLTFKKLKNNTYAITKNTERIGAIDDRNPQPSSVQTPTLIQESRPVNQESRPTETASPLEKVIIGKVSDERGEGLPGVSVLIKGTQQGTTTNSEGSFKLAMPDEPSVLVFSFVGYLTQEIAVGNQTSLAITLHVDQRSLDEVVVVGYGTVKKSDLTGSVSSVKGTDISAFPSANVMQGLSGRASGVQVKQNTGAPGGTVSVRIRGTNSIQGSNEPLYVIDGFPVSGQPLMLNNSEIESIEILKDASAVAIYGSRGANGVVLISTKSGKEGKMRVDYESNYGSQQLRKKIELMNAQEYATFYNILSANQGTSPSYTQEQINSFGQGFDWQDFVFRKAPIQTHSLNISGGNAKTQFSVSGSYYGQDGIIKGSDYQRYGLRTNINHSISNKIKVAFSTTLSRNQTSRQNSGGGIQGQSLISASLVASPIQTPYNDDGTYRVLTSPLPIIVINPLNFINETSDKGFSNKVLANASLSFEPLNGLILKVYGGVENSDDRNDFYRTRNFFNQQSNASVTTTQFTSLLNENTITYSKNIGAKHKIVALGGFTYQDFVNTSLSASGTGFLSDVTESYNLAAATIPGIPGSSYAKSVLLSYLGRVNYSFNDRILATVSFRSDGSSKYSEGNKWGFFPSAALAWKVKEEPFLAKNDVISDLKLRGSWGRTGSQAIDAYATLNQLAVGKTVFGDALYNTFAPSTTLPGNLKWETTEQTDFGMDLAFLNNRIQVTADYYIKNTQDLLNSVQLPSSMGFTNTIRNIGIIQNKGFEFSVNGAVVNKGAFKWDLNGNIAFNKSKVVKLYGGQQILTGRVSVLIFDDNITMLREGEPMGVFYGYQEDGYDQKGSVKYKDINNDGVINTNDKVILGNPNPKFIYGLNSFMSYKGIDLSLFWQGSQANDIANISGIGNTLHYSWGMNMLKDVLNNTWTPENPNAKYPKVTMFQNINFSNRFIEDGSYLRLRNIELGYSLPTAKWNLTWIRNAKIYVSGQNLLTFTKYSWWDPDVNSAGGASSVTQGIDFSTYPVAKSYTVGLRVGF
ncbi:SusC/RagA family TonB-linked outer membrane protein [Spirosoma sp. HMF4905]|uniref:SusC/RagA family TonB-linked outer membrane protein n=1 Tax=Spirosoma arboris TaxID=2682092 RepID=A0A7K1SH77_9BACT|nr:TonB-dependent receptor [Spirosoma arboris]MVM33162.1 SusC/RagA family TonB-linked outer membrane protein [Spirosoma arboris]